MVEDMADLSIKSRSFLNKKLTRAFLDDLTLGFGEGVSSRYDGGNIEVGRLDDGTDVVFIGKEPTFFKNEKTGGDWIPFVQVAGALDMKYVVVDQPAVPYMAGGADVMRPGIVEIDDRIEENDVVAILDEKNKVALAIGRSKHDARGLEALDKGKVIKSLHHVGDSYFAFHKKQ